MEGHLVLVILQRFPPPPSSSSSLLLPPPPSFPPLLTSLQSLRQGLESKLTSERSFANAEL
eukprot:617037-Hanusia_phi.AAC.1